MAPSISLPGLNEDESLRLKFSAENGVVFDDEMRGYVVRMISACPAATAQKAKKKTKKKAS